MNIRLLAILGMVLWSGLAAAQEGVTLPAPAVDEPATLASETAVLAGGCFWGVQGVFQHVKGVPSAVSGYAGGRRLAAHYELVGTGTTGHAESVQVTFDPRQISYGQLLQIFFSAVHDPTQRNRQGPDSGTQYRSAIFPTSPEQATIAQAYIAQLDQAHLFQNRDYPVLTDYRGLFGGLLQRMYGLQTASLQRIFAGVKPVELALV